MSSVTKNSDVPAALESILCTDELTLRPSRSPDFKTENEALVVLAQALADSPRDILKILADTILKTMNAQSAGISLISKDETKFVWPAISGVWKDHIGGGTPRNFGPCGDVLDRNAPLMMKHVERRYTYFQPVTPAVQEALLVPFYVNGIAVGTIWAIAHDVERKFDAEDMRLLISLGKFASSAYQVVEALNRMEASKRESEVANNAKDKFLAALSHELRTPLSPVVMTLSEMESNPSLPATMRDDLKMIQRNVELEIKLIDDLLDVSRIASGKLHLQFDVLDINDLMRHACNVCRSNIHEKGIHLHCRFDDNVNNVVGDPARLQQVFWNLLKNAVKFTPEGGDIFVSIENIDDNCIRITIRDTGMGIAPEVLPHIFNAFEQGDIQITRQFGGLGLGLAISKVLVDQHKGSIRAETEGPKKGSTFIIELPGLPAQKATESAKRPNAAKRDNVESLRLLIAEDHVDTAAALKKLLVGSGHLVMTASTAATALTLASEHTFDVVVSDLGLPDMTGYELMQQLKQKYSIQGIAMSGFGMEEDIRKSELAGFSDHLTKPVSMERLEQAIRRVARIDRTSR